MIGLEQFGAQQNVLTLRGGGQVSEEVPMMTTQAALKLSLVVVLLLGLLYAGFWLFTGEQPCETTGQMQTRASCMWEQGKDWMGGLTSGGER